ncbi:hypothetical protein Y032_0009g717 [Ancylostoma ceylanicum]|uniref:PAN-3 domain-containing protein n=1 Tax=Ancylostoma ceylanicum TaxID=53326 RepID=A0A016VJE8_9BILA|nr:hypothetical protein Y032_0009g717 [Ancylostoma ceylanicum]
MHTLQAAVLLAFVATARGQCSLTIIKGSFVGGKINSTNVSNREECVRECYDDNRCDAIRLGSINRCDMYTFSPSSSPFGVYRVDVKADSVAYKVERREALSCVKVGKMKI